tara:strand:- start:19458 stop:19781 length:324 start_codon:yes stop_codon:yes gene_type:complete
MSCENRFQVKYKEIISKHAYESAIFPIRNQFSKVGEKVFVDGIVGEICDFNSNGTLYIKTDGCDMGRDYRPYNICSNSKDTKSKPISMRELLNNHRKEILKLEKKFS